MVKQGEHIVPGSSSWKEKLGPSLIQKSNHQWSSAKSLSLKNAFIVKFNDSCLGIFLIYSILYNKTLKFLMKYLFNFRRCNFFNLKQLSRPNRFYFYFIMWIYRDRIITCESRSGAEIGVAAMIERFVFRSQLFFLYTAAIFRRTWDEPKKRRLRTFN